MERLGQPYESRLKRFLKYIEIQTKITSVLPFLMTLAYLFAGSRHIEPLKTLIFFAGMLLFDLTATTINNYSDTKKNHQVLQFKRSTALLITAVLLLLSVAFGIWLVTLTDIVVLALGALCFFFGIIYSYGPIPLSHGPYGEIFSGLFYGVLIPVILVYINDAGSLMTFSLSVEQLSVKLQIMPAIGLGLLSVAPFCLTANIMLANNICDVEHDVRVNRYTLAFYLKDKALYLFSALYYTAYLSVIALVVLGYLSPLSLLLLITLIPVQKNINVFYKKQDKAETFVVSVKNFIIFLLVHTLLVFIGGLF
jgi:1,4-dihydroxy-2-naphthoate octaprenyltransferase